MNDNEEIEMSDRNCVECGNSIPQLRIDVIPGATTCVACANKSKNKVSKVDYSSGIDISQASEIDRSGFARSD
jgi:RNA polymerase-binding transcription factor DksA